MWCCCLWSRWGENAASFYTFSPWNIHKECFSAFPRKHQSFLKLTSLTSRFSACKLLSSSSNVELRWGCHTCRETGSETCGRRSRSSCGMRLSVPFIIAPSDWRRSPRTLNCCLVLRHAPKPRAQPASSERPPVSTQFECQDSNWCLRKLSVPMYE